MKNYNISIYLKDDLKLENLEKVELPVKYNSEYELKKDITGIGVNGFIQKQKDDYYLYYPPHRIQFIQVVEVKS